MKKNETVSSFLLLLFEVMVKMRRESERVCMCAPMVENTIFDNRMRIVNIAKN